MKINIWYCKDMSMWRWILVDDSRPILKQESGQQSELNLAMNDIKNKIECLLQFKSDYIDKIIKK